MLQERHLFPVSLFPRVTLFREGGICYPVSLFPRVTGLREGGICYPVSLFPRVTGLREGGICYQSAECGDHMVCKGDNSTGRSFCRCDVTYVVKDDGECGQYIHVFFKCFFFYR